MTRPISPPPPDLEKPDPSLKIVPPPQRHRVELVSGHLEDHFEVFVSEVFLHVAPVDIGRQLVVGREQQVDRVDFVFCYHCVGLCRCARPSRRRRGRSPGTGPEAVGVRVGRPHEVRRVVCPVGRLRNGVVAPVGHDGPRHKVSGRRRRPRGQGGGSLGVARFGGRRHRPEPTRGCRRQRVH